MAEPPRKRRRRSGSVENSKTPIVNGTKHISDRKRNGDRPRPNEENTARNVPREDRRIRSRSREREHRDRRRRRSQDRDSEDREHDRGDRRQEGRLDDDRRRKQHSELPKRRPSRSRSPVRESKTRNDAGKTNSPPRAPRAASSREQLRYEVKRSDKKISASGSAAIPLSASRTSVVSTQSEPHSKLSRQPLEKSMNSTKTRESGINGDHNKMDIDVAKTSDEELEQQMQKVMGFGKFRSTKNTKVPGNDKLYGVRKEKRTEYRQYMNRVGGFNRPLSPSR